MDIIVVQFSKTCLLIAIATFSLSLLLLCSVTTSFVLIFETSHSANTNKCPHCDNRFWVLGMAFHRVYDHNCFNNVYLTLFSVSCWNRPRHLSNSLLCLLHCSGKLGGPHFSSTSSLGAVLNCKYLKVLLRVCILFIALDMKVSAHTCWWLPLSASMCFTPFRYLRHIPIESNNFLAPYLRQQISCRSSPILCGSTRIAHNNLFCHFYLLNITYIHG